jgi:hypothetical protein
MPRKPSIEFPAAIVHSLKVKYVLHFYEVSKRMSLLNAIQRCPSVFSKMLLR